MTHEKIMSVHHALGELAGRVAELEWGMVRLCRDVLVDCAEQVENLEMGLEYPRVDEEYCLTNIRPLSPEEYEQWKAKQNCVNGDCNCRKVDVSKEEPC